MKALFKITILLALVLPSLMNQVQASPISLDKEVTSRERSNWKAENIKVSSHGEIEFNEDYTDVIDISDDGYLKISMVSFGMKRKLYFRSHEGQLDKLYFEGKKQIKFEPKGREWMQEVLPQVVRNSGLDLENRVNKFYKKGGLNAFLSELEATDSDYFKSRMVHYLLDNNELTKKEKGKLLKEFPANIDSDYELSQILKKHNSVFIDDSTLSLEFFNSLNQVSSDHEVSQILKSVFKNNKLNEASFELFISAMNNIDSDFEKSNLIKLAISEGKNSTIKLDLILNNLKGIDSDYEKGIIIKTVINEELFDLDNIDKIIELSRGISSDYEHTQIMKNMIKHEMITPQNKDKFKEMMDDISSDYSYKEILMEFMEYDKLGEENFDFLIEASEKISSSYELSQLYKMMLNKDGLSTKQQITLIEKASHISSDYEYASFLLEATRKLDLDNEKIQNALIDATQKIDSEYDYGKIMKAIYSHKRN
ncbi:hypothetical protein ACXR6G_01105 [Ancylomarina sp. YFZ004]